MKQLKGFTLIELLIVIALLGALAIGLLATIDPFEQLKKGRDTSMRNTVSELYNANLRYYATKSNFPWNTAAATELTGVSVDTLVTGPVQALIDAGELKSRFVELATTANLNKITISSTDVAHIVVCFTPESKSFQNDPNTIYDANGSAITAAGVCGAATSTCSYCVQ